MFAKAISKVGLFFVKTGVNDYYFSCLASVIQVPFGCFTTNVHIMALIGREQALHRRALSALINAD